MTFLAQAAIFLGTAVIVVPLFRRLKLGAVLGYLAAGALIGPWGLGVVPHAKRRCDFAELGVVLLLFLVGLELEPSRLWALRQPVFGLGGAQVLRHRRRADRHRAVRSASRGRRRRSWASGSRCRPPRSCSRGSGERGELSSPSGRRAFAILLFQDLAVIPLIALLPLLAPERDRRGERRGRSRRKAWRRSCSSSSSAACWCARC